MKKIYSILLIAVMSVNILGVKAQNSEDYAFDPNYEFFYQILSRKDQSATLTVCEVKIISFQTYQSIAGAVAPSEAQIASYNSKTDLVIPAFYSPKSNLRIICVAVADDAYKNNTTLKTVRFSGDAAGTALKIGNSAFSGCTSLDSVMFANRKSIEIGRTAFYQCENLDSVKFKSVDEGTTIGLMAFANCSSLDACGFIEKCNLTGIADQAFAVTATGRYNEENESYSTVTIPESVKTLGRNIFAGTPVRILQIDCPFTEDYPSAELSPFYTIREQIEYVDFSTNTGDHAPAYICYGMKNATFDFGQFKTFGAHSFDGCESFSKNKPKMWIPSVTTSIGDSAFVGLHSEIVYLPVNAPTLGKDVFGDMKLTATFIINYNVCLDSHLEAYAESNEDFMEMFLNGNLYIKGENRSPSFDGYEVLNATPTGTTKLCSSGSTEREPLCGVDNFVLSKMENAYFVALQGKDTLQKFPFSHFEYNGNEYLGGDTVQLASDNTQKVKAFYSPIAVKNINATVTFPEAGDPSDGSTAKVKLSGSSVRLRGVTLLTVGEEEISEETLKPGTTYKVRFAVAANTVSYYFRKKSGKPDLDRLTITVNGETAENVDTENSQVIVFAEFKTEGKDEALNDITTETKARKVFRNGQLVIIRGDKEYNALGAEMK